jgi:hypothetical protein
MKARYPSRFTPDVLCQRVCRLLGISQQHYMEQQFEAGLQWLASQLPHDPAGQRLLASEARFGFWPWWRRQWFIREHVWWQTLSADALWLVVLKDSPPLAPPSGRGTREGSTPLGDRLLLVIEHDLDTELYLRWQHAHRPEKVRGHFYPIVSLCKTFSNNP